ncbi:caspase family protein [uncultured Rubinisphaera sp.]|uniref:caspase family protein n=1 Tax=uncultured Rubinisphaera sp. TaxID=1678686 RepID=UPI0030DC0413
MKSFFYILACLTLSVGIVKAAEEPILVLETGGNTSACRWIQWTPDGMTLLSGGDDKVIRVWDMKDPSQPTLSRTIRGEIGQGNEGKLATGSLSPDGRWLATGGFSFKLGIRIIDLQSGEVHAILKGFEASINELSWSADGSLLAAACGDGNVLGWDMSALSNLNQRQEFPGASFAGHSNVVIAVAFLPDVHRRRRVVSGSWDQTARLWEEQRDGSWRTIALLQGHNAPISKVACSNDGRWLATSSTDSVVRLWNQDGEYLKTIERNTGPLPTTATLDFSDDSRQLIIGNRPHDGNMHIVDLPSGRTQTVFKGHTNTQYAGQFRPDIDEHQQLVASTGGNAEDIWIWDAESGESVGHIVGTGNSVYAIAYSPDGSQFAFGQINEGFSINADGPLVHAFDLFNFSTTTLDQPVQESDWERGKLSSGAYSAELSAQNFCVLNVYKNGRRTCQISRSDAFDRIDCFAFIPGRSLIVVGSEYQLTLHNAETGKRLRTFEGHTGIHWSVAISPDGQTLASGASDQTIRFWELGDVDRNQRTDNVNPLLNFFITTDAQEWIAWTEEGYYAASPNGDEMIGWHTNRGIDQSASFVSAWQYSKVFQRPEIVELVLTARSTERAIELAAQSTRTRPTDLVDVRKDVDELAVPEIQVETPQQYARIQGDMVRLKGTVTPKGSLPVKDFRVMVNKRPVNTGAKAIGVRPVENSGSNQRAASIPIDVEVPLLPGLNLVEIVASTSSATSQPYSIEVTSETPKLLKPTLYVVGLGVADYEDESLTLKYPDDDVNGVIDALTLQKGKFYQDVQVEKLINDDVTERNVRRAMKNLQQNVTQHDVAILIVSGHGYVDYDGSYFFCPYDFEQDEPSITGIRWTDFTEPLKSLPCKVVLCMDTCHAAGVLGPAGGEQRRNKSTQDAINRAVNDLTSIDSGVVVLTSSTGKESSFEDDRWGHGAFALAIIEALTGKKKVNMGTTRLPADLNDDHVLELIEIDAYLTNRVKELTDGRQHPITERGRLPSFPLAISVSE